METAGAGWRGQVGLDPGRLVLLQIWGEESQGHHAAGPGGLHRPFPSSEGARAGGPGSAPS